MSPRHVRHSPGEQRVDAESSLTRALRELAAAERQAETPPHVETAIMAAWDAAHAAPPARRPRRFLHTAATIAAGMTIVCAAALQHELAEGPPPLPRSPVLASGPATLPPAMPVDQDERRSRRTRGTTTRPQPVANTARASLMFVGGPIASNEIVRVVRMRVTRSALTELGITATRSTTTVPTDMVDVDVLIGEDGVARGLRVGL
jgi:hypothetical protein